MTLLKLSASLYSFDLHVPDSLFPIISVKPNTSSPFTNAILKRKLQVPRGLLFFIMMICLIPLSKGLEATSDQTEQRAHFPQQNFAGFLASNDADPFNKDEDTLLASKMSKTPKTFKQDYSAFPSTTDNTANGITRLLYEPDDVDWHQRFLSIDPPYTVPDTQINQYVSDDQSFPSVAFLKDGSFIIVWYSKTQDGSGCGIYARRYSTDAVVYNDEFQVNTNTIDDQTRPSIAALQDGGCIIV